MNRCGLLLLLLLILIILYAMANNNEGFYPGWWYYPCIYDAENNLRCDSGWDKHKLYWKFPSYRWDITTRNFNNTRAYQVYGDPYPIPWYW